MGKMLIGTYQHSLDTKGRVIFPAKLREDLGESFVITRGLDGCIFVYPEESWQTLGERIKELSLTKARNIQREFFANATIVEPDKQGRILIPANLREYAKLEKDLVIIGAFDRAEIWDEENWLNQKDSITEDMLIETMDDIGL